MEYILVVGLGNIGSQYDYTPHNIGFHIINEIACCFDFPKFEEHGKFVSIISKKLWQEQGDSVFQDKTFNAKQIDSDKYPEKTLLLMKPTTYMNKSGLAIQKIKSYYKISNKKIIVIHDEFCLPLGKIRIKDGGSDAGHNGIKSIDQAIGKDYWRIRVGVKYQDLYNDNTQILKSPDTFVLKKFTNVHRIDVIIKKIALLFPIMLSRNKQELVEQFNSQRLFLESQDNQETK